jgi:microcystin-dependent protein
MSDPFVAEIRMFGFEFAPQGWANCNGAIYPIRQNTALYALLGTSFGGDGINTFGLPNLQSRVPMHANASNPAAPSRYPGQNGGSEYVTLQPQHLPAHSHAAVALSGAGTVAAPGISTLPANSGSTPLYTSAAADVQHGTLGSSGSGGMHNNMPPYLVLNFCIALQGAYPNRP